MLCFKLRFVFCVFCIACSRVHTCCIHVLCAVPLTHAEGATGEWTFGPVPLLPFVHPVLPALQPSSDASVTLARPSDSGQPASAAAHIPDGGAADVDSSAPQPPAQVGGEATKAAVATTGPLTIHEIEDEDCFPVAGAGIGDVVIGDDGFGDLDFAGFV